MKSEDLAQWYFRLNGFLTIPNFILHPLSRGGQRTEVDIVGFRFPHRREFATSPGEIDDAEFTQRSTPYLVLAEVKAGWVGPNDAWRSEAKQTIEDLLTSLGIFEPSQSRTTAEQLRSQGHYDAGKFYCSLFFIGENLTDSARELSGVPHRTWTQVLSFIHGRFSKFADLKADTPQWDETGRTLLALALQSEEAFMSAARRAFYLPAA